MSAIVDSINQTPVCHIKVGETHAFRDIWMVVADDRLFCRQYSFSPKSWRTALLAGEKGYLKVGDNVYTIRGVVPADLATVNEQVNAAYIDKYVKRLNYYPSIAREPATLPKHQHSTVEILLML